MWGDLTLRDLFKKSDIYWTLRPWVPGFELCCWQRYLTSAWTRGELSWANLLGTQKKREQIHKVKWIHGSTSQSSCPPVHLLISPHDFLRVSLFVCMNDVCLKCGAGGSWSFWRLTFHRRGDRDDEGRRGQSCIDWIVRSAIHHEDNKLSLLTSAPTPCILASVLSCPLFSLSFPSMPLVVPRSVYVFGVPSPLGPLFSIISAFVWLMLLHFNDPLSQNKAKLNLFVSRLLKGCALRVIVSVTLSLSPAHVQIRYSGFTAWLPLLLRCLPCWWPSNYPCVRCTVRIDWLRGEEFSLV